MDGFGFPGFPAVPKGREWNVIPFNSSPKKPKKKKKPTVTGPKTFKIMGFKHIKQQTRNHLFRLAHPPISNKEEPAMRKRLYPSTISIRNWLNLDYYGKALCLYKMQRELKIQRKKVEMALLKHRQYDMWAQSRIFKYMKVLKKEMVKGRNRM